MSSVKSVDRELSPEKNEAILRGAMQEFLEHGYAGARIDKIVAAAGVSKATVYRHFADKQALFTALIQRMSAKANLFQRQDFQSSQEPPDVFLRRYASEVLTAIDQDPQGLALLRIIIGESGRFPKLAQTFVRTIEKPALDSLTQYFAAHTQFQLTAPEVAARTLVGTLIHFVMVQELLYGNEIMPLDRDRLINNLVDLLTHKSKLG